MSDNFEQQLARAQQGALAKENARLAEEAQPNRDHEASSKISTGIRPLIANIMRRDALSASRRFLGIRPDVTAHVYEDMEAPKRWFLESSSHFDTRSSMARSMHDKYAAAKATDLWIVQARLKSHQPSHEWAWGETSESTSFNVLAIDAGGIVMSYSVNTSGHQSRITVAGIRSGTGRMRESDLSSATDEEMVPGHVVAHQDDLEQQKDVREWRFNILRIFDRAANPTNSSEIM